MRAIEGGRESPRERLKKGGNMKSTLLNSIWAVSLLAAVAMPIRVAAQEQSGKVKECSNATLHGGFGYTSTGTLLASIPGLPPPLAGPFAEVGRQTFDGKGNTDATATLSANGNIQPVTIAGTYTVNPDCTGSMTLTVSPLGLISHLDFVIGDDGAELRAIVTDSGGFVESRVYSKQFRDDRNE
jgi:hypothetical protein